MFEIKDLSAAWKNKHGNLPVFSNVNFALPENKITALCGVNGSGKSTLLSLMSGIVPDTLHISGKIVLGGRDVINQTAKERAKQLSHLVQNETNAWEITARKLVENGRYAHQKWYENLTEQDSKIVDEVLESLALTQMQDRPISNLSGGELQRFRIARSLAQQTPYIFLDEPLAGLDLNFQKELMQLLKQLCQQGKTICISIHDINLATTYADNIIFLKNDRSGIILGTPEQIITPENIEKVYGKGFEIYTHPITGAIQVW